MPTVDVLPYEAGAEDELGNPTDSWGAPVTKQVIAWAPGGGSEVNGWRHVVTADLSVYAFPGFTCGSRDRMVVAGKTYEVEGDVEDYAIGVVVNLNRIEGSQ